MSEKYRLECEGAHESVQKIKELARQLAAETIAQGDKLCALELTLNSLRQFVGDKVPTLRDLQRRIDRLKELRNIQELGSFEIQVTREMQKAWEALP